MAKTTIGPVGQIVSWVCYLLLLYSLLCAYIAGGSDLFHNLLLMTGVDIPVWIAAVVFTLIFGAVVFFGVRSVDIANRWLMLIKLSTFFVVVIFLMPFVSVEHLMTGNLHYLTSVSAIMVTTAAFGWATLIPSLRVYFAGDIKQLKIAIVIGSIIPLICYIVWDAAIMGVIPLNGENSLVSILNAANSTSSLVNILSLLVGHEYLIFFIKLFTSVCVLTSFLGVALCLTDFFADGLQLEKKGSGKIIINALTFLPAVSIAIFFPNIFIKALEYAGIYSTMLLIFLPAWMAWCGRYRRRIAHGFTVPGGKFFLALLMGFSLVLIVHGFVS